MAKKNLMKAQGKTTVPTGGVRKLPKSQNMRPVVKTK